MNQSRIIMEAHVFSLVVAELVRILTQNLFFLFVFFNAKFVYPLNTLNKPSSYSIKCCVIKKFVHYLWMNQKNLLDVVSVDEPKNFITHFFFVWVNSRVSNECIHLGWGDCDELISH